MTLDYLKAAVEEANDFYFTYNGRNCGVEQEVKASVPTYYAWYGDDEKQYSNLDDVFFDPFFGGMSITDLISQLDIHFA